MYEWIPVEVETQGLNEKANIRGVEVELLVSPYDVPKAIRGYYDDEKHLVIEFRYIDNDEPLVEQRLASSFLLFTGESSKRLFKIVVEKVGLDANTIIKKITEAISDLAKNPKSIESQDNYKLAKHAFHKSRREIAHAVA